MCETISWSKFWVPIFFKKNPRPFCFFLSKFKVVQKMFFSTNIFFSCEWESKTIFIEVFKNLLREVFQHVKCFIRKLRQLRIKKRTSHIKK